LPTYEQYWKIVIGASSDSILHVSITAEELCRLALKNEGRYNKCLAASRWTTGDRKKIRIAVTCMKAGQNPHKEGEMDEIDEWESTLASDDKDEEWEVICKSGTRTLDKKISLTSPFNKVTGRRKRDNDSTNTMGDAKKAHKTGRSSDSATTISSYRHDQRDRNVTTSVNGTQLRARYQPSNFPARVATVQPTKWSVAEYVDGKK
jgi:hypothetical protein